METHSTDSKTRVWHAADLDTIDGSSWELTGEISDFVAQDMAFLPSGQPASVGVWSAPGTVSVIGYGTVPSVAGAVVHIHGWSPSMDYSMITESRPCGTPPCPLPVLERVDCPVPSTCFMVSIYVVLYFLSLLSQQSHVNTQSMNTEIPFVLCVCVLSWVCVCGFAQTGASAHVFRLHTFPFSGLSSFIELLGLPASSPGDGMTTIHCSSLFSCGLVRGLVYSPVFFSISFEASPPIMFVS